MFKGLGDLSALLKEAQQMGGKMQDLRERLKLQKFSGSSGGGMVEVEVNGLGEVLRLQIDPQLVEHGEREMIEDLVPAAVNQALLKAKEQHAEEMKSLAGGLPLPGLDDALSSFLSDPPTDPSN